MTEVILQRLEERVLQLLSEIERLRYEYQRVQQENTALKGEKEKNFSKLQGIVSLLESLDGTSERSMPTGNVAVMDAVLLQG